MATKKKNKDLAAPIDAATELAMVETYGEMEGEGWENQTSDDIAIPFLGVLQALSPEVTDGDPKRLEGAKPGQLINTLTQELIEGDKGIHIIPCLTDHVFVEWVPRDKGGGYVAAFAHDSPEVKQAKEESKKFGEYKRGDNDLIETFYMYALLLGADPDAPEATTPIIVPFTGSKIKVYKKAMTPLNMFQLRSVDGDGKDRKIKPPMFSHRLHITVFDDKNRANQPFKNLVMKSSKGSVLDSLVPPLVEEDRNPLLTQGQDFRQSIKDGVAKAAYDSITSEPSADAGGGDGNEAF